MLSVNPIFELILYSARVDGLVERDDFGLERRSPGFFGPPKDKPRPRSINGLVERDDFGLERRSPGFFGTPKDKPRPRSIGDLV
jgi:hypothetical protein